MKQKLLLLFLILILGFKYTGQAQPVIAGWNFSTLTGGSGNYGPSPYASTTTATNSTVGGLTRGTGVGTTGTGAGKAWGGNNFISASATAAITANQFSTFTISASTGYLVSLSSIAAYNIRRSSSGPTSGQWQYKIGTGSFVDLGSTITWGTVTSSAGNPQTAITLSTIPDLQNVAAGITITFRVVCWGGTGAAGTWYFNDPTGTTVNDLIINGTLAPLSTPTLTVLPSSLIGFTYQIGTGPSTSQSYNLTGSNLTGYPGNITVTGSTDYEVSLDNSSFDVSKTVSYTSATLGSTPIYVRLKSGLVTGDYNNETIENSGGGVSTAVNVTCSGSVTAGLPPVLSVTPGTLNGFTYAEGAGPSASQNYNLSGSDLTGFPGSITITGSADYEVSTDNTSFGASRTIAYTTSTLASTPVYVRLKSGLAAASYNGELVANAGGGTVINITCNGTVTAATTPAVNIAPGGSVTENFTIGTSATASFPTGWKADKMTTVRTLGSYGTAVSTTSYRAGDNMSSSASNGIYNYAVGDPTTSTERAVGGISSGSASQSVNIYVQLRNNGTSSIPSLVIGYDVEKYRKGSNAAGFSIQMYYSTDGTTWVTAGTDFLTSFTGGDVDNSGYAPAPGETQNVTNKTLGVSMAAGSDLFLAWNYSVTSGTTTSNAQALGIDNVSIVAGTTPVTALPSFAPPAGSYYFPQTIVITCSTQGAVIHYTTDGSDPTEASPVYPTVPISLSSGSGTTTIKSRAYATGYDPSSIATAVYVLPTVVEVANMAALRAGTTGPIVYRLTGQAFVSYFRSLTGPVSKQMYLQDNTGAIMVYDNGGTFVTGTYTIGDGITGLTGRLQNYNNMIELIPVMNPGTATSTGNIIIPEVKTIATLTSSDQAKLVKVVSTTFTGATGTFVSSRNYPLTDASGSGFFRTSFSEANYISTAIPTSPVDIVAIVTQYIDTVQLTARNLDDFTISAPLWTSGWPKAENAVPTGFSAKVNINSTGTSYLVVLPDGAPAPTSAQVKAGQDATGTAVGSNFKGTMACPSGNTEYILPISGMANSTTYNVYFVAEIGTSLQGSPVMKIVTTASGTTAPVVSSPTVTSITANSAILGGNVIADGGSTIIERGTVWSTTTPVTIADNKLAEGGVTTGVFSHLRSSVTTGVTIYFAAYATNSVGTSLSPEGSFLTLIAEPTNHPQDFTAGTTTGTTIPLSWTDALASQGDTPASGYLIKGSALGFIDIIDPVDGMPETNSTLVHNILPGVQQDTMTNLTPGTAYYFKLYAYNSIGGSSINYKTFPAPPQVSATTDINLYESYNYSTGSFVGGDATAIPATTFSNNWTVHSGTGNIPVAEGSLSYNGLAGSTGKKISVPGNNNATTGVTKDINRAITAPGTVLYFSGLINVVDSTQLSKTATDYFMHFATASGTTGVTTFGGRLGILKVNTPATGYRLSIQNTSGGTPTYTQFAQDLNFGSTYLVVVKYDRSASPTVATLWVNPTQLGGPEPEGSVSNTSGTSAFSGFGSICIRNGAGTPQAEYDEIRVGTTFAQVTPLGSTNKMLNITSVFPEGLYAGSNSLNIAYDEVGPHFQADTADMITVELHNSNTYSTIEYSTTAGLVTSGSAMVSIPGDKNGAYYLTIKHRNTLETTSALPVDFAGTTVSYSFDSPTKSYAGNMGLMIDGTAVLYAGDENQDGIVDGSDLSDIGNLADYASAGYLPQDINGDGLVDGSDLSIAGNNADSATGAVLP